MLDETGYQVSTKKEEVEKQEARASNSTFLPCSFRIVILITTFTSLGYWLATGILPGGIYKRLIWEPFSNHPWSPWKADTQRPINQATLDAEGDIDVQKEMMTMYLKLAELVRKCQKGCCVYHADGKDTTLNSPDWTDSNIVNVELCKKAADGGYTFHLRMKESNVKFADEKLEPLEEGHEIAGLLYGKWFWKLSNKQKEYLLCNMLVANLKDCP